MHASKTNQQAMHRFSTRGSLLWNSYTAFLRRFRVEKKHPSKIAFSSDSRVPFSIPCASLLPWMIQWTDIRSAALIADLISDTDSRSVLLKRRFPEYASRSLNERMSRSSRNDGSGVPAQSVHEDRAAAASLKRECAA